MSTKRNPRTSVVMVFFGMVLLCVFCSAASGQYCNASGGCGLEYISDVQVGRIDNDSGCNNYGDYTYLSTTMEMGRDYTITVTNGNPDEESQCGIWVDWNADGDFNDAEEAIAVAGTPGLGPYTASITPPGGAVLGETRMRARIRWQGVVSPCGDTPYGEVEDYTVFVVDYVPPGYGGGTGEPNDPYLIYTAAQMNAIGANPSDWDRHFRLMADIDLGGFAGARFNIIGFDIDRCFTGVFDGDGHTISNFTYSTAGTNGIGLFGFLDGSGAEIKNLGLIDPNVNGVDYVGALVGQVGGEGTISNCYAEGGSVKGRYGVGGLVGANSGVISNCSSRTSVEGDQGVGGLVGGNWIDPGSANTATIINCYANGSVSGSIGGGLVGGNGGRISNCSSSTSVGGSQFVGGLVGANWMDPGSVYTATIINCYANGSVSGGIGVGGLVGSNVGTISNCYSTGGVSGNRDVGGLVGTGAGVYGSFWDVETSGLSTSAGGEGKTSAEMEDANTYLYWGCEAAWTLDAGVDSPRLWWENAPGELLDAELGDFVGGAGTESEPYLIYTAEELNLVGLFWCEFDKHFKLMADIDLSAYTGTSFNIIGFRFSGVFDGSGHTISNFSYGTNSSTPVRGIGLFKYVDGSGSEIKDLGLIDPNVGADTLFGPADVGSLVAFLKDATISGCYVEGGRVSGVDGLGGLVGVNGGEISNCYSTARVVGRSQVGGLVGNSNGVITDCYSTASVRGWHSGIGGVAGGNGGEITNCYSLGDVQGWTEVGGLVGGNSGTITKCYSTAGVSVVDNSSGDRVGGLVGGNGGEITNCYSLGDVQGWTGVGGLVGGNGGEITNCCSLGDVQGQTEVGGLVGDNEQGGRMTYCYSIGSVSGSSWFGGLVGRNGSAVGACFWDTQTSGLSTSAGGDGKTTGEMQMASTFTSAGWDFTSPVWTIDEGVDYPRLAWEAGIMLANIDMDEFWMYQSLPGQSNSDLTASVSVTYDPVGNTTYSYEWEILLPGDVTLAPVTVAGGGGGDAYWTFAARGCDETGGLSDSGQTFTVRVTVTGDDYGNTGQAEAEFGIALLGDINNDKAVNVADRSIANAFWRTGSAGAYTLRDCDVNCDGAVNVADRSIANAIWRGILGQNSVSSPCPLR
ncbi:MAG: hypothetical protein JSV99_10735 [Planctomycetota bacterium]|nr:MAG: hypothetical protein JSV99_10735 [Planctomycetota bacterium]